MFPLAESPTPMLTIPLNITPKIPFQLRKGIHLVKKRRFGMLLSRTMILMDETLPD